MSDLYELKCENYDYHVKFGETIWHNQRCYVKVKPTDRIRWCFTCEHKPYTDGLGYEYKEGSGCEGSDHDIGELLRIDNEGET